MPPHGKGIAAQIEGITCTFGGKIVLDIDKLHVGHGERVAIVGHNGAGKSSLLRLLSGFVRPERGTVTVLDRRLPSQTSSRDLKRLRGETGQVLQGLHLVQHLSALENVMIGALGRLSGWRTWARCYGANDVAEGKDALRAVGLLTKSDVRVDKLSGGERQKVAIARMLMQRPRLILADEPTAALDPQAAAEVCALLAGAARQTTLICVVHNPALLPLLAERVVGLKQGRITFDLPVAQVDTTRLLALYRAEPAGSTQTATGIRSVPGFAAAAL